MPKKPKKLTDDPAISSLLNDIQVRASIISMVIGGGRCKQSPPFGITPWIAAETPSPTDIWMALKQLSDLVSEAEQAYKELHQL